MHIQQKGRTHEGAPQDEFTGSILTAPREGVGRDEFKPSAEARSAQCALVLAELMKGARTTSQLHAIHVLAPAARVMELRRAGVRIDTLRRDGQGCYVLREGAGE